MLEINNLSKQFETLTAVDEISLTIQKGEVLGLLGHNGAGKSTTIKMILGIVEPTNGDILWDGTPIRQTNVRMGYLPEERGLYEKTKVYDQLLYFGKLEGMKKSDILERMDYWLNRLGIPEYKTKTVKELSKGNKQKIQLIAAVLHDPELVILDEPFSGLDPINANVFAEIIQELIDQQKTIIMSSHRMEQLDHFCQKIMIMKKGKSVLSGNIDDIKKEQGLRLVEVQCEESIETLLKEKEYQYTTKGKFTHITLQNDEDTYRLFQLLKEQGHVVRHFVMREPTLHEIFVEVVGK